MLPYFGELYGNPSSGHAIGARAEQAVEDARDRIAAALDAARQRVADLSSSGERLAAEIAAITA